MQIYLIFWRVTTSWTYSTLFCFRMLLVSERGSSRFIKCEAYPIHKYSKFFHHPSFRRIICLLAKRKAWEFKLWFLLQFLSNLMRNFLAAIFSYGQILGPHLRYWFRILNADAELMIFISIHNFFLGPPFCNIGYDICHVGMGVIQTRLAIFRSVGITIMLIVE